MKKVTKGIKTTVTGVVVDISEKKEHDGDEVINVDIRLEGSEANSYIDLAFWGLRSHALLQGKKLSADATKWEVFQPEVKKGALVEATGFMRIKSWKPTKSKTMKKMVKKGQISIYSHDQLKVKVLPAL